MIEIKVKPHYPAFIVDDCDADLFKMYKFNLQTIHRKAHDKTYLYLRSWARGRKKVHLHVEVAKRMFGEYSRDLVVDHINKNTLDNRRSNIRLATRAQNAANKEVNRGKVNSKFKGVRKTKLGAYAFTISTTFKTEIEAAEAYDRCARIVFGEFACLNFPEAQP